MQLNIGAPQSYSFVRYPISNRSYVGNLLLSWRAEVVREMWKVGRPADRTEWQLPADTVNAWYDNAENAMVVPAGILQPPFFAAGYPAAQNFGGIGSIIGHEVTHGFDVKGSRYDEDSRPTDWWTPEVREDFWSRSDCIADLYGARRVANQSVDGYFTLGENIADIGGMRLALAAFLLWHREVHQSEAPDFKKRTFFVAYAQLWCASNTPEEQRSQMKIDVHSPKELRANVAPSQDPRFAEVFQCARGSPMNPPTRCSLW
mmetsp:Transcript_62708/g.168050  ORF Transcript_62708/g.168050 Transcript_62708/m.168050 type:complete len:260 (-) Transcript_62708:36-815(-)